MEFVSFCVQNYYFVLVFEAKVGSRGHMSYPEGFPFLTSFIVNEKVLLSANHGGHNPVYQNVLLNL